jgi:formyl-CoA transferase
MADSVQPLAGLRVLELGQLIAGPFAGATLAGFGADVIKVEAPGGGDPLRKWRKIYEGTSLWWRLMGRNKRSIAIDLRQRKGQTLIRRMVAEGEVDVLIENFRPGRMEKWGLGYEALHALNPRLIMARISGWGQTGPRADRPGFANVAESVGGLRYLSGEPGRKPVRAGVSIGDSLAGLHAALGVLTAVYHRDVNGTGEGQVVDVALQESVFNMLESLLPEFDVLGHVRERSGAKLEGIVPTSTYPCLEGRFVVIGANSDSMFKRLMTAIGRDDLGTDPRLAHNDGRVEHEAELDEAIAAWTARRSVEDVVAELDEAEVAVGPIQSIADIARDPQFLARGMFESATLPDGREFKIPAVVPRLTETPGETRWIGPGLGAHTREVLGELLSVSDEELAALVDEGVVAVGEPG